MSVNKQFSKKELMVIVERFIIPFLSIENEDVDKQITFQEFKKPKKKKFIEYDTKNKIMKFYPTEKYESYFMLAIKCECNKKIKIIRDMMSYVLSKKNVYDPRFINNYFDFLIEEGFVNWLALRKDETAETLMVVLKGLKHWAVQTFEGEKKSFVIGVNLENSEDKGFNIRDIIEDNFFATITEAYNSAVVVNRKGVIIDYVSDTNTSEHQNKTDYVLPVKSESIVRKLNNLGSEIIFSLEESGSLLVYKVDYKNTEKEEKEKRVNPQMKIVLALRGGKWLNYDPINFKNAIHGSVDDQNISNLFSGILDVSLEHSGGSIAILDEDKDEKVLKNILSDVDNLSHSYRFPDVMKSKDQKRLLIENLLLENNEPVNFYNMDRYKRLELLNMDGATIIDKEGNIIAMAAIIKNVKPSDDGGSRTASVKELSNYGVGIKISTDGGITVYKNEKIKFKM